MKKLLHLFILAFAFATCAPAQEVRTPDRQPGDPIESLSNERRLVGKVVGVADGDTITLLDDNRQQHKIRLEGIDAPESNQDFGQRAKQNLSDMIYGKTVTVVTSKVDKYKRFVGKILLDGRDVNLEQIKAGYAWHYKKYAGEQKAGDRRTYADAEIKARNSRTGLWVDANPTAPWNWRSSGSKTTSADRSNSVTVPVRPTQQNSNNNSADRTYIRGPRGGCYYINRNGNKTYVDRSLCN